MNDVAPLLRAGTGAPVSPQPAAAEQHWLTPERIRGYSWLVVVIFGLVLVMWTAAALPTMMDAKGKPIGFDFMAFWSAARLAVEGRAAAAFSAAAMLQTARSAIPGVIHMSGHLALWHYPPICLLLLLPLGLLPYLTALAVFMAGTVALWAALVRRVLPDRANWIVAAALPAGWINVIHGQNGFLTAALAGFALILLDSAPIMSGVLIGLLALKPHLALMFPIALIAGRHWRTFGAAAATVSALGSASFLAFGWTAWAAFFADMPHVRELLDSGWLPWGMMPSVYACALSLGAPDAVASALQGLVAAAAAACVWFAWRRPAAPFEARAATLVIASLLAFPYVFYYDLTWAGLALAWLARDGMRRGFFQGEREVLLIAFLCPIAILPIYFLTGVQIGFVIMLALLAIATRRAGVVGREAEAAGRRVAGVTA
jgi:hypothetical protein